MSLLPVEEALRLVLKGVERLPGEEVPIAQAGGRILAEDLRARRTQPPFDVSAMDGYAVRADDLADPASRLRVVGESAAGRRFSGTVRAGETVRIFTGAPVPAGADTILLQEDAAAAGDREITAKEAPGKGRHIRRAGLDFREGDTVLSAGRRLDPAALSVAAAANHPRLPVVRRPRVAILATGDELVTPGAAPGPDQIVASNSYGVGEIVRESGASAVDLGIVGDDMAALGQAIERARGSEPDVLVTLGGASVGDHDLVADAMREAGMELAFWKIAMRPGKPLMAGRLGAMKVLGLPGNPVSSLVCAHLFLRPLIAAMLGLPPRLATQRARLAGEVKANDHRQDYVRAEAWYEGGDLCVRPLSTQDSSMLSGLSKANALLLRPPSAPAARDGDPCEILPLREIASSEEPHSP